MEKRLRIAKKPRNRSRVLPSIVGGTYGRLLVLDERRIKNGFGKSKFEVFVRCVCNKEYWVEERSVRRGDTKSCGCSVNKTHGMSKTPEYAVWRAMVDRCQLPTHQAYKNYGGRGITVCKRWLKFENFFEDMGRQPFKGASIDRINNNKGYTPRNCRWVNATAQGNNRRTNKFLTIDGITKTYSEWAKEAGLKTNTLSYRLANGWSPKAAVFTTPNFTNKGDAK